MPLNKVTSFVQTASSIASSAAQTVGTIADGVNNLRTNGFGSLLRSRNLPPGGEAGRKSSVSPAEFHSGAERDWRVRLSLPKGYETSDLIGPLVETNGLVFPYTPQITITHSSDYQSMEPIHNNYPFLSYQKSSVEQMTIVGDFFVEDSVEARYWVGAVHFLRSVTKMRYGGDSLDTGAPPPVLKLNGYGDYVFKNVPVVVKNFTMDLPKDVDYIATGLAQNKYGTTGGSEQSRLLAAQEEGFEDAPRSGVAWAPVRSVFTVTVQPLYSRQQVREFSLEKFVKGDYVFNGKGFI
jgi:hypothetical protein